MGWSFRRSLNFGPIRINFSKSGIGFSFGVPGLRGGVTSNGRKYYSAGVPGTGVRYYKSSKDLSTLFFGDQKKKKSTSGTRKQTQSLR